MIRRLLYFLATALPVFFAAGCGEKPEPVTPDTAPTDMTLSAGSFLIPAEGMAAQTISVTAPVRPAVSGIPAWISWTDGTYDHYRITYTFSVAANTAYETREADITVMAGSLSRTIMVTQEAGEKPAPKPDPEPGIDTRLTHPKASAEAQKVYSFLCAQNGSKTLSGVQSGGTANNNERIDAIAKLTGKHPAVAGYDYIFLQYSPTPSGWDWKVDYSDISAAREQWQKNGLVSYMWHWNVPTSQDAWEKGKKGDFDGYNFYCDKTKFDIKRALTDGTWENDFLLRDIEKVAGYLKLLQKEGIPVLWRPLHEAAGNYNLYGGNGAWFWWGRGGAESCKQLWKLLRDKLEGEYRLDNLIWVWTLDATPGAESQYADWYPGNDMVEIIGVDIYADDTAAKSRQYEAASSLSGGRKLTTISECGNIPDPEKCFAGHEAWSWFLVWDLESYPLNTDSYWKKLMGSSRVMTREAMPSLK